MPVVNHLVPKVGVLVLQTHHFAPRTENGVQERPESFHLPDFVEYVRAKCSQSLHFLGDDVHVSESLHPMTTVCVRSTSSRARPSV